MVSKEAEWPTDWWSVFERFHGLVVPAQRNNGFSWVWMASDGFELSKVVLLVS
jgi:hypothetical protein